MSAPYDEHPPTRVEIDRLPGATILEFGADWCGYCRAAEPLIRDGLGGADGIRHLKVADGPGRPLGRSYRVKLWPTLVFVKDGTERGRVVRPESADEIRDALATIAG